MYADARNKPGKPVYSSGNMNCNDSAGSFACRLAGKGASLKGGKSGKRYWVSVVANCNFTSCGQWGWTTNTIVHGKGAVFEQGGGKWTRIMPATDMAFVLTRTL